MNVESNVVPETTCPVCGYKMNRGTELGSSTGESPRPGDLGVCLKCGEVMVYTEAGLVKADLNDMLKLHPFQMEQIESAQNWIREKRPIK